MSRSDDAIDEAIIIMNKAILVRSKWLFLHAEDGDSSQCVLVSF